VGIVALGAVFYGIYSMLIARIPMFSEGDSPNASGKLIVAGLMIMTIVGIYASDRMGMFSRVGGNNLLIPGIAVAAIIIFSINNNLRTSNIGAVAEHSFGLSMFLTALIMIFLSTLFKSADLIMVAAGVIIVAVIRSGLASRMQHHSEDRFRHDEGYRERMEGKRRNEEKKVRNEQGDELSKEEELSRIETNIRQNIAEKEKEILQNRARLEKEEDQTIHRIYAYIDTLNKANAGLNQMSRIAARGRNETIVRRVEELERIKYNYKETVRGEMQKLSSLLVQEASLDEKFNSLTEEERKEIGEEIKSIQKMLRSEQRDVLLERREMRQTAEEAERAINRGEIKRIQKEEYIFRKILADMIKRKYMAKKEEHLTRKFGRVFKYDRDEMTKILMNIDKDDYVNAAKELKKLLGKVRREEGDLSELSDLLRKEREKSDDAAKRRMEEEDILRKEEKAAVKEVRGIARSI